MIDSQSKMAQTYGYMVCLIAVVVVLVSIAGVTNSLFDYADPIHSDRYGVGGERPVTSFNAYRRAYYDRQPRPSKPTADAQGKVTPPDTVSEATLRQMYQEDRTERIDTIRFRALKSFVGAFLLLVVSIILFTIHWKWLRRQSAQPA
jgi:hypothetical protein